MTTVLSALAFFLLPPGPMQCRFLTHHEKMYVAEVLRSDGVTDSEDEDAHRARVAASCTSANASAWDGDLNVREPGWSWWAGINWREVGRTLTKPHVLMLAVAGFFNGATLGGLA